MKNWIRFPLVLATICALSALGVGSVYVLTKKQIDAQEKGRRQSAREDIFGPGVTQDALNDPADPLETVYRIEDESGRTVGYMTLGVGQGYSSKLQVMVGVDADLTQIVRIKILDQKETPGLGTRVEEIQTDKTWLKRMQGEVWPDESEKRAWFQLQFDTARVTAEGVDQSAVDTISGATISSNATLNAVDQALARITHVVREPARSATDE